MRTTSTLTILILVLGLVGSASADVIVSNWMGQDENEWMDSAKWLPKRIPFNNGGDTFAVTINTLERTRIRAGFVANPSAGIRIDTLDCYGDVDLEFGEVPLVLADPNGLTNYGRFQISGAGVEHTIVGNFNNTNSGYIQSAHSVELHGTLTNAGELFLVPHSAFSIDANITNEGEVLIYAGMISCGSVWDNMPGGTIKGEGLIYVNLAFNNQGIVTASGPLLIATNGAVINSGTLCNDPLGALRIGHSVEPMPTVNEGTVEVNPGGVAFEGDLVNEPNGIIQLRNGVVAAPLIMHSAGATLEGFGGITGDLIMEPNSLVKLAGPTQIVGNLQIGSDATLQISDGTTIVTGLTICEGNIRLVGGRIIPQGGLNGTCNITWESSLNSNAADFNLDGKVNFADYAYFADT